MSIHAVELIDDAIEANRAALNDVALSLVEPVEEMVAENRKLLGRVVRAAKRPIIGGIRETDQLLASVIEPLQNHVESAIAENAGLLASMIPQAWQVYCDTAGAGHYSLVGSGVDQGGLPVDPSWPVIGTFATIEEAKAAAATCGHVMPPPQRCGQGLPPAFSGCYAVLCNQGLPKSASIGFPDGTIEIVGPNPPTDFLWTELGDFPTYDEALTAAQLCVGEIQPTPGPIPGPTPGPAPSPTPSTCLCIDVRLPKPLLDLAECLCAWLRRSCTPRLSSGDDGEPAGCTPLMGD